MYIRSDLEEAIKKRFGIKEFVYRGMEENNFSDHDLPIFDTDKGTFTIEFGHRGDDHLIYKVKEISTFPGYFLKIKTQLSSLYTFGDQTYLKSDGIVTSFQGKAFDFTQELVVLALEQGGNWNVY